MAQQFRLVSARAHLPNQHRQSEGKGKENMEDNNTENNINGSSGSSERHTSNNIAQRFSRQISRSILPALRNLVRSNRTQRARVAPEAGQLNTSITGPAPPSPQQENSPNSAGSPLTEPLHCANNEGENVDISPPAALESASEHDEALQLSPASLLPNFTNLMDDTAMSEEVEAGTPTNPRQRYRLVVYFEERSPEEHPTARYVAVIVGRLDELQFLVSCTPYPSPAPTPLLSSLSNRPSIFPI